MTALTDADQDAGLREEIARAGFAGWYGRDEYDKHPVQGMWERAADAIMRGPLATLRARATAAEDKLRDREAEIERLRGALREIPMVNHIYGDLEARADRIEEITRAALASTDHPASSEEATDVSGS